MIAPIARVLRDLPGGPSSKPVVDRLTVGVDDGSSIRCRSCGARLAERSALFAPGEGPLVFANPAGMVFELRTVRAAPGVAAFGAPTTDATWFSGYAWRVAVCARCRAHVGWQFLSVDVARDPSEFFGLIAREVLDQP